MKKSGSVILVLVLTTILILSVSFISASWFSDLLGKLTGNVVGDNSGSNGCVDSDGGKDYYVKGSISQASTGGGGAPSTTEDFCMQGTVVEHYCGVSGEVYTENYTCPNGCSGGACINNSLGKPNLIIENISLIYQSIAEAGLSPEIVVFVKNIGDGPANASTLRVEISPRQPQLININNNYFYYGYSDSSAPIPMNDLVSGDVLLPGQSERFYEYFQPSADGTLTVNAYADSADQISESNEEDNSKTSTFQINKMIDLKSCIDSDGVDFNIKGKVTQNYDNVAVEVEDACIDNIAQEYICEGKFLSLNSYSCPNGCQNGACISSNQTTTCTDSDVGLNYYVKGNLTTSASPGTNFEDYCLYPNAYSLIERHCLDNQNPNNFTVQYECPYGCQDGACVNANNFDNPIDFRWDISNTNNCSGFSISDLVGNKTYILTASARRNPDNNIKLVSIRNAETGEIICQDKTDGERCYIGNVILEADEIELSNEINEIYFLIRNGTKAIVNSCVSNNQQVCFSLIEAVKNPQSTGERQLSWNESYIGYEWINKQKEKFIEYRAGWDWNSPEDQETDLDYYYAYYDIQIFDNKDIDLSEYASWKEDNLACKATHYWTSDDKENTYYICNWDVFSNNQDINEYNSNNREIFWCNGNVVVRMNIYWGEQLTDQQITQLSQQRINDLLDSLQDNQYQYIDWSNFNIEWPASNELYTTLDLCGSDINFDGKSQSWSCKTEPVICPPHGYQTKTCKTYDSETQSYDTQTSEISCSPGMCAGCYVPKWLGDVAGDNKCIPYGFRFEQGNSQTEKFTEQEIVEELIQKGGLNITFSILPDNSIYVAVIEDILINEEYTFEFNVDGTEYNGVAGETLQISPGYHTMGVSVLQDGEVVEKDSQRFLLSTRYFANGASYFTIKLGESYNAYCDIDGRVKRQKIKDDLTGDWAGCQNSYECDSNLCSRGQCVEILDMTAYLDKFRVRGVQIFCKLSNLFSLQGYDQCLVNYSS